MAPTIPMFEEEEWQQMVMYRRDTRFAIDASTGDFKLQLDRTVIDMLHCPMRANEKVLNLLYEEILNGKTKNEVNGPRRGGKKKKQVLGCCCQSTGSENVRQ